MDFDQQVSVKVSLTPPILQEGRVVPLPGVTEILFGADRVATASVNTTFEERLLQYDGCPMKTTYDSAFKRICPKKTSCIKDKSSKKDQP